MKLIRKSDPRETDLIELGRDPYVDRLYGCFRFDNPRGDGFRNERTVEIIFRSGRQWRIVVPESLKVALPERKAVNLDSFFLEPIGDHLDTMLLLTMRAGWNQTEQDLVRIVGLDPQGSFVARFSGPGYDIPVATASVAPLGERHTWIGMILVHPELRRQGVANAMMQHCVLHALEQGKVINGLDATPMGNTVYGAVGYVDSFRIWRCWFSPAEFRETKYDKNLISRVEEADLDKLIRYDSSRWLERSNVIRALYQDSREESYLARDGNGEITGYLFARPGRIRYFVGPFLADSRDVAANLLACACRSLDKKGEAEAFIDTPEIRFSNPGAYDKSLFDQKDKPSGHALIKNLTPVRDFTRMYQVADERKAESLVRDFRQAEGLPESNPRVEKFARAMRKSVANCTESQAFLEYEARVLQNRFWGITGPEKG
ncbi:MAG: GNAT family N-acetyltransferase [Candidatus Glassbacteria bacterium]